MRPNVRIYYAFPLSPISNAQFDSDITLFLFFLGNSSLFFSPNRTRHIWKYNEFSYVFMRYIFHNLFSLCSIVFFFSSYSSSSSFSSLPRMRTKYVCRHLEEYRRAKKCNTIYYTIWTSIYTYTFLPCEMFNEYRLLTNVWRTYVW